MCGIFGIVRERPAKFDYSTFCTLGIANDSRGGDSCGVFIDGKVEYGVKEDKLFQDFFTKSTILENTNVARIALGHCRKASVGAVNIATAQPVIIQNENNETEFVVLHNGTIYNYEALAKKYIPDVDIKGMTDSQVMARIFYYKGYDVLEEYNGGAVFFIVDYREEEPKVMFFKGASRKYENDKDLTDERPLYLCITGDEMVFSSIPVYLLALRPNATLYTASSNVLGQYKDGKLFGIKKYNRSKCQQTKEIEYPVFKSNYIDFLTYNVNGCYYTAAAKRLTGEYFISDYGGVYEGKPAYMETLLVPFFNGIPFVNRTYYKFVEKAFKKSQKTIADFTKDNLKLIEYLSMSRLHFENGLMYLLESPEEIKPFTGDLNPLGSVRTRKYTEGSFVCEIYDAHASVTNNAVSFVNLKALKKLWNI